VEDVVKVMEMADVGTSLDKGQQQYSRITFHGIDVSRRKYHSMAVGRAIQALRKNGFSDLVCVENETVVTSAHKGEIFNKQSRCANIIMFRSNIISSRRHEVAGVPAQAQMLVLDKIFPDGIRIPDYFIGKNVVHLPTTKCHIYTNITGSMKNAFAGC